MDKKKKGRLLQTTREINIGSGVSGIGFLLYLAARVMGLETVSGIICIVFAVVAVWTFFSAIDLRGKDKNAVSYNLLWGTGSLAIMLGAFAVLTVKMWLGM